MPISGIPGIQRWSYLEVMAGAQNEIVIDSVAGDISLSTITMPNFIGTLASAYLALTVQQVRNSDAVNNNGIAGAQNIQLRDAGLIYRNALVIQSGSFQSNPSEVIGGTFEYMGAVDIKQYIEPSGVYLLRWEDADADNDSLILYGTQMKMRLFFKA